MDTNLLLLLGFFAALVLTWWTLARPRPSRRARLARTPARLSDAWRADGLPRVGIRQGLADHHALRDHGSPTLTTWRYACSASTEASRARRARKEQNH